MYFFLNDVSFPVLSLPQGAVGAPRGRDLGVSHYGSAQPSGPVPVPGGCMPLYGSPLPTGGVFEPQDMGQHWRDCS